MILIFLLSTLCRIILVVLEYLVPQHLLWQPGKSKGIGGDFPIYCFLPIEDRVQQLIVPFGRKKDTAKVVAQVLGRGFGREAAVARDVEHQSTIGR